MAGTGTTVSDYRDLHGSLGTASSVPTIDCAWSVGYHACRHYPAGHHPPPEGAGRISRDTSRSDDSCRSNPPTLIIVGEVVKLHQKLAWFEPGVIFMRMCLRRISRTLQEEALVACQRERILNQLVDDVCRGRRGGSISCN